jgi:dihydrodipicolinate synthase/N-acetylneuraminate lyase
MSTYNHPVYPLVPSFDKNEEFDKKTTQKYLTYLEEQGAQTVMTTAGTSQFNLLSIEELRQLNDIASGFGKQKILGLPSFSSKLLHQEISLINKKRYSQASIMLLFPERYYHNSEIIEWAHTAADLSEYPVLLHGMFMRKGTGGMYNYTSDLYNDIITHPNIIGTKEETSDLGHAFNVVAGINDPEFSIIVAGGTLRRFMFLNPAGADTFLSGVGSFFPKIEERFYQAYIENDIKMCRYIIRKYETPMFHAFNPIGWHPAMRESLKIMGLCNQDRKPFAVLRDEEKNQIKEFMLQLETTYQEDSLFK